MTAELADTGTRTDWGTQRSRTVVWHEWCSSTAKGLTMAGIDNLRAMVDGDLPQPDRRAAAVRDRRSGVGWVEFT